MRGSYAVLAAFLALAGCDQPAFDKGVVAYKAKDYAGAMKQWRPLAERGDARAQSNVGELYYEGLGVKRDPVEASKWFSKAAAQGDADAQANLGVLYMTGQGEPRNFSQARLWFAKAAAQDHAQAAFNLGVLHDNGQGGPVDKAAAVRYYTVAAELGDATAAINLGVNYATGEGVAADPVQACKWMMIGQRRAADAEARTQADADLARLKPHLTPAQIAAGEQAAAAFKPRPPAAKSAS